MDSKNTPYVGPSQIVQSFSSRIPCSFLPRRSNTKKVPLTKGNLVLDCPAPTQLMDISARKEKEFSMMRYTAVTCDPDQFAANQYTLRPQLMNRNTELFVAMTMYNVCNDRAILAAYIPYIGRRIFILSYDAWCHEEYRSSL